MNHYKQRPKQRYERYESKYKVVGVLPIWKVKSNISSVGPLSERISFSLTKGLHSKRWSVLSKSAVHQPFHISNSILTAGHPSWRSYAYSLRFSSINSARLGRKRVRPRAKTYVRARITS